MGGSVNNAASSPLASGDASKTSAESEEITAIARGLDEWYTHLGRQYGPLSGLSVACCACWLPRSVRA